MDRSGNSTTCDGPHVTRDTHVGLVACGCPCGWLGSSVCCLALSLACPSTTDFSGICGCRCSSLEKCTGTFLAVLTFECSPTGRAAVVHFGFVCCLLWVVGLLAEYCNVSSSKEIFVAYAPLVINRAGKTNFICRNLYKTYESVGFVLGSKFFLTFCTTQDENQSGKICIDIFYRILECILIE